MKLEYKINIYAFCDFFLSEIKKSILKLNKKIIAILLYYNSKIQKFSTDFWTDLNFKAGVYKYIS